MVDSRYFTGVNNLKIMKKNNNTKTLSDILNSSLFNEEFKKDKINKLIKQSTVFSFWESVCGKKFSPYTKPYLIKGSKIYISTKSPVVEQELNLYKKTILQKLNSYSLPLGIKITDMVFNYKNFNEVTNQSDNMLDEDKPVWYSNDNFTEKNANEEKLIADSISKISFLTETQKEIFAEKLIIANRAKNKRKTKI